MDNNFREAFYEVDEILKFLPNELLEKIPKTFKLMIKKNKSTTYSRKINGLDDINSLKKETRVIMYYMYRDFFATEEECKKMKEEEIDFSNEKYSYEKLFLKKENEIQNEETKDENKDDETSNNELVVYEKVKWYTKIINFIKSKLQKAKRSE